MSSAASRAKDLARKNLQYKVDNEYRLRKLAGQKKRDDEYRKNSIFCLLADARKKRTYLRDKIELCERLLRERQEILEKTKNEYVEVCVKVVKLTEQWRKVRKECQKS